MKMTNTSSFPSANIRRSLSHWCTYKWKYNFKNNKKKTGPTFTLRFPLSISPWRPLYHLNSANWHDANFSRCGEVIFLDEPLMRRAFFRTLLLFVAFPFWFSFIIGHHRVGRKKKPKIIQTRRNKEPGRFFCFYWTRALLIRYSAAAAAAWRAHKLMAKSSSRPEEDFQPHEKGFRWWDRRPVVNTKENKCINK